ncbi:MAG TPA: ferric reductase-like transmembrane domain-containing protein, partial [Ktedonobacteraceae bacterium]|nr:ferric reductase-like transmembrane domain-containing protein [Ktedonobacteraceae bacterium]
MNTLWQSVTWDVARAGGFTAYILLALAVAIGLALTMQLQSPSIWPRIVNSELHNFVTLLALVFTTIHVLAVTIDPFTNFGLNEVLIPFVSHYRPIWMALGIVALYLGLAIGLSTWVRPLIGYSWWRRLHVLTLVVFALVTVHGIATGSDTQSWWGFGIYAACIALIAGLLIRRLLVPANQRGRKHPVFASATGLATLATLAFMIIGPMRPGWNALAGGTSSASAASATQGATSGDPFASSFAASLQGTMTQSGPDASGITTLNVHTTLSNGAQGVLTIVLQGAHLTGGDDGLSISSTSVTLGTSSASQLYQG